jgi:hypothetical protein
MVTLCGSTVRNLTCGGGGGRGACFAHPIRSAAGTTSAHDRRKTRGVLSIQAPSRKSYSCCLHHDYTARSPQIIRARTVARPAGHRFAAGPTMDMRHRESRSLPKAAQRERIGSASAADRGRSGSPCQGITLAAQHCEPKWVPHIVCLQTFALSNEFAIESDADHGQGIGQGPAGDTTARVARTHRHRSSPNR